MCSGGIILVIPLLQFQGQAHTVIRGDALHRFRIESPRLFVIAKNVNAPVDLRGFIRHSVRSIIVHAASSCRPGKANRNDKILVELSGRALREAMVKRFLFSHWLSSIVAMGLCLCLLSRAATAQEDPRPSSPARESVRETAEPGTGADKAAPVADSSKPVQPQPLSEEESAKLAARAQQPGPEVAGGALSNLHLTYIVIALAAIVLVLVLK